MTDQTTRIAEKVPPLTQSEVEAQLRKWREKRKGVSDKERLALGSPFLGVPIGPLNFHEQVFDSPINFNGAIFTEDADFYGARFTQEATFNQAQFVGRAIFTEVEFTDYFETVAAMQSFSSVDDGNLPMYPGEERITWRISSCPDLVNTLPM